MTRQSKTSLTALARAGFTELSAAAPLLAEAEHLSGIDTSALFAEAADPDAALRELVDLLRIDSTLVRQLLAIPDASSRLIRVLGASAGLAEFFSRHPGELTVLAEGRAELPRLPELAADLLEASRVDEVTPNAEPDDAWNRLRVRYRRRLAEIAAWDLEQQDAAAGLPLVACALAELAAAALDASLAIARRAISGPRAPGVFDPAEVAATRLAVIGMGKGGASELNYLSDVDVIYVAEGDEEQGLSTGRAVDIATRLAVLMTRGVNEAAIEPGLWEVDANLRPEGRDGALVRSLGSHLAYYDRWAKSWEFQALLKARPLAGDRNLGERYVAAVAPRVWNSSARENFVESVQGMRERVTDNIPDDEVDIQLKLGPGGLRDIEFTVQLLQLVHGQVDESVREAGTLPALAALAAAGYIGRVEAEAFAADYRILRLMEHRLQLQRLRRTHLMPRDERAQRVLARGTGLATTAGELLELWAGVKQRVRGLHERLFYRPLLAAVAAIPVEGMLLSNEQAEARLAAIGFRDSRGALSHIAALSGGFSRKASIQRALLPVMLRWLSDGADPDYGLLAFRRLSDAMGQTHWYMRMLRDSSGAAERLTRVLSGSRFVGELLERIPEAVAWLEDETELRPHSLAELREETASIIARHETPDAAATVMRTARRREILRLALSYMLGFCTVEELGLGLSDITSDLIDGILAAVRGVDDGIEFAVIGMGRLGGRELGFGSDADVVYVYRDGTLEGESAQKRAAFIIKELNRLSEDSRMPLDLDIGLRPEGKNGAVVRSLDSYRAYYQRWSLTWEAQALLRASGVAGDASLQRDFEYMSDDTRYPAEISERAVREVKRIKARVESERLPQAADPTRHLKLGRGSLSDVEWFVQLLQLQHANAMPELRTTSTLEALEAAASAGLIIPKEARMLRAAWIFASRARSAMTLWTNKTADVLPEGRRSLDGVARLMGYPPGSASVLEQDYLAVTRRARGVFERRFYGPM